MNYRPVLNLFCWVIMAAPCAFPISVYDQRMGPGVALFDFDNDGDLDVFLVQDSVLEPGVQPAGTLFPWRETEKPRGRLFRHDLVVTKEGRRTLRFTDVTEKSGIVALGYGMGVAVGDINND